MRNRRLQILPLFCILFISISSYGKTIVISDIDDTLRITNRLKGGWLEQAENVVNPYQEFSGMQNLLATLRANGADIYYVTGTISALADFATLFLDFNGYPQSENLYYRGIFENIKDFKVSTIQQIIDETNPDQVILIGDNGESDSDAYQTFQMTSVASADSTTQLQSISAITPSRAIFVAIHKLYEEKGVAIPQTQSLYVTAGDLAAQMESHGILTREQSQQVIEKVAHIADASSSDDFQYLLPNWAEVTPTDFERARFVPFSSLETQNDIDTLFNAIFKKYTPYLP